MTTDPLPSGSPPSSSPDGSPYTSPETGPLPPGPAGRRVIARMQMISSISGMLGVACLLFAPFPFKYPLVLIFCGFGLVLSIRAALIIRKRQARLRERLQNTGSHPE